MPCVSIGVPVYNGEKFLCEALDSLLAQTFTDFELIISDNASDDQTEIICRQYSKKDSRIKYIRQPINLGVTANFKFVLDKAIGEYFMWAAADDLQDSRFLEELVKALKANPFLYSVMCDVKNVYESEINYKDISTLDDIRLDDVMKNWNAVRSRFFRNPTSNIFFTIYGLFRIDAIKKIELNYRGLVRYATFWETPILAQLAIIGPICSIKHPLKTYRMHENSTYHIEQSNFQMVHRLSNFLNVSYVLISIISHSDLVFRQKIILYTTVISSTSKKLSDFVIRRFILRSIKKLKKYLVALFFYY